MLQEIKNNYTEQDHYVWTTLYIRTLQFLPETADKTVLDGIKQLEYPADRIPDFSEINQKLKQFSDWQIVPMDDMVDDTRFISMLAEKKYPCRNWLRTVDQLEADIDEYDMFHDIIGHTPLLLIPAYSDYLTGLGKLAQENINNKEAIVYLKKIYWHTIQFGLKLSEHSMKIYGAHFLSSRGETIYSLSAGVPKYDLNVPIIMDTAYIKGRYQDKYFVIENYERLKESLTEIKEELSKRL